MNVESPYIDGNGYGLFDFINNKENFYLLEYNILNINYNNFIYLTQLK